MTNFAGIAKQQSGRNNLRDASARGLADVIVLGCTVAVGLSFKTLGAVS